MLAHLLPVYFVFVILALIVCLEIKGPIMNDNKGFKIVMLNIRSWWPVVTLEYIDLRNVVVEKILSNYG